MKPIGFKEWSLVCDALGTGRQSVIIRKGGIAEGREGFQFQHPEFHLFPTHFHEQAKHFRGGERDVVVDRTPDGERESITIRHWCQLRRVAVLEDWEKARALAPLHGWTEETVRERFEYGKAPGISVALVRVHELAGPWTFPNAREFGGCRSWIELPECPVACGPSVLGDEAFESLARAFGGIVD